jgi:hypothetical protein
LSGVTRRRLLLSAAGGVLGATGLLAVGCGPTAAPQPRLAGKVAVLRDSFPGFVPGATDAVIGQLRADGMTVDVLDGQQVGDAGRLTSANYRALVLGDARFFPAAAVGTLAGYLMPGGGAAPGNLVAIGGPFLSALQTPQGGQWIAAPASAAASLPSLTGLIPVHPGDADQSYVISEAVQLSVEPGQVLVTRLPRIGPAGGLISPVYRPRGLGMVGANTAPPYRFIPVVTARGTDGALRGAPGAALLHAGGRAAGAGWILLGLSPALLASAAAYAAAFTAQALAALLRGA